MTFEKLTKRNARAFFELYVARKAKALHELGEISEKTGGPKAAELDFSAESLVPIWIWARDRMPMVKENGPNDLMPPWYDFELRLNPNNPNIRFSPEAADLIDKLAYYWGETLIHNIQGTKWDIDPYPESFFYCRPVVRSEFLTQYPIRFIWGGGLAFFRDPKDPCVSGDSVFKALERIKNDEAEYRVEYEKAGGHVDPRVRKKVTFE